MPQYQGIWSLQSAAQLQSTQRWVTDPSFDYTTLLLQADNAANGAQNNTFIDSSSNNFTITRNGNTTQGTFTPYSLQPGAWSNFFNGTTDFLSLTQVSLTGDFTIEAWLWFNTGASNPIPVGQLAGTTNKQALAYSSGFQYYQSNGGGNVTGTIPLGLNQWIHLAVSRVSGTVRIFTNGALDGSTADTSTFSFNRIGCIASGTAMLNGYISNLRVLDGTGLYTTSFTPSSIPLTAITNTALLTCQSNAFVDTNTQAAAKTLTVNGTPSVQAFSPFAPQYQWTAPVIGGSGYFDGTGDYLSATGSSATQMGTGAFTWECWCYITTTASYQCLIDTRTSPSSGSSTGMALLLDTGTFTPIAATTGTILTSSINVQRNAWNHVALTRTSGGTLTIWVNGASGGTVSNSTNLTDTALWVGGNNTSPFPAPVNGYLSNTRITKGADLYTATFTPPTAPLTTTVSSGTVGFLLNYTNAGIYDGTMKNNLETVGNAQVSTSVVKYGTGSMAFDGTGDWCLVPSSQNFNMGTGDWTVECWAYASASTARGLFQITTGFLNSTLTGIGVGISTTSGNPWRVYHGTTNVDTTLNATIGVWNHVAFVRFNGVVRLYINGTSIYSATDTSNLSTYTFLTVGAWYDSSFPWNGYIDDFRITKGVARYTANFTPPTVALPRQ